jgi:NAD+ kinase
VIQTIGISAKVTSPHALDYASRVIDDLGKRGLGVCLDFATADKIGHRGQCVAKGDLGRRSDLLITFGGDGTLLSVARHAPHNVPILGVNMGTLGFLTEVRVEEFPDTLEHVLAGEFYAEERMTFDVSVRDRSYRVLNDATINKTALARIVDLRVMVSGAFVSNFRADGLIVATPTGSTAYNLSAGGPIIHPAMSAIVITPICPHMLTNRPVVLPDGLEVEVRITNPHQEVVLTLDGQEGLPLTAEDCVRVRKSEASIKLVRTGEKSYFDVLRAKLKWGEA